MEYFNTDRYACSITLELRCNTALRLIEHFGSVAGTTNGEDSAGRAILTLQTPEELVTRCFKIADLFVSEAEKRNGIKNLDELKK